MKFYAKLFFLIALLFSSCSATQERDYQFLTIRSGSFNNFSTKGLGRVFLKSVKDDRQIIDKRLIGQIHQPLSAKNIVNTMPSGCFISKKNTEPIEFIVEKKVLEALNRCGYSSAPSNNQDAILEVVIREFWLTPDWHTTQKINLIIIISEPTGKFIFDKNIKGEFGKFVGLWNTGEFEEVIQNGMDDLMKNLLIFFSSEEFRNKVNFKGADSHF